MNSKTNNDVKKGYFLGLFSGITWGLDTVLIALAMTYEPFASSILLIGIGAFVCSFFHDSFASLWVSLFLKLTNNVKFLKSKIKSRDAFFCVIGAIMGGPIALSFYYLSIKYAGPSLTAVITSFYPVLGVLLAKVFLKEKVSLRFWIGLSICMIGIIILSYSPFADTSSQIYLGILFAGISALGWASESVVCAYGMKNGIIDPDTALTIREITSALVFGIVVIPIFAGGFSGVLEVIKSPSVLWIIGLAGLLGTFSYIAWYRAIDTIGASRAISLNVTYSFWAIVFTILIFGGDFSLKTLICGVMIILGVILGVGKPEDIIKEQK